MVSVIVLASCLLLSVLVNLLQAKYSHTLMERLTNPPKGYFSEQAIRLAKQYGPNTRSAIEQAAEIVEAAQGGPAPEEITDEMLDETLR